MLKSLPAVAARATVVAASATVAAVLVTLPGAPATPAAPQPAAPTATLTVPVAPVAPVASVTTTSPAAQRTSAMQNALGKLGAPYRYGAAGPNAFDCSGLVNWAFRSAGKSLPRSSSAMARTGTPVAKSDLQPGDLVFFYKPVSHVAIYIGNGKVVHASSRKSPVKVADMNRMPFNSARRV